MTRGALLCTIALLALARSAGADDSGSPHTSTAMCSACHNEDMSLQRSKLETCTLCHGDAPHSGAAEHARLEGARVKEALAGAKHDGGTQLPLTDDGRIWCGTCHLYHEPSLGDAWLPMGWVPPDSGLPGAVREGVSARWKGLAAAHGDTTVDASFANKGTRQLRLPVENGALCNQCHGGKQ
jgi:hypothetical protein